MTESRPVPEDPGEWRMLSAEQLRTLARRMIDVEPLLYGADPAEVLARLGWQRRDEPRLGDDVVPANSGLGLGDWSGELWLDDDDQSRVVMVTAFVCEGPRRSSAAFDAFLRDAFAQATRALTEEFGAPTEMEPGKTPEVRWRVGAPILRLTNTLAVVNLKMQRARDFDEEQEAARYGA